jgi:hypothetical protein
VVAVAAELGVICTEAEAQAHFKNHGVEQPHPSVPLDRGRSLAMALGLTERAQEIIDCVYRMRVLSTEQLIELFYRPGTVSERKPRERAWEELPRLAAEHLLYRYWPTSEVAKRRGAPERMVHSALWFLGRNAVPFIEDRWGVTVQPEHYTTMAAQVGQDMLIHDLRANGIYVRLARALRERGGVVEVPGQEQPVPASLEYRNWFAGGKHLTLGFHDPSRASAREIKPDGFFTLSLARSGYGEAALPSCQLPCFVEYDHGSRGYSEVVEQLLAYHRLAAARPEGRSVVSRRFPDLDVEGYAVPIIMVFSEPQRVVGAGKRFRALARDLHLKSGAPIFLCHEAGWLENPLGAHVAYIWDEDPQRRFTLVDLLLRASGRLIESRRLLAQQRLRLDVRGARPTAVGSFSPEEVQRNRQRRQKEARERAAARMRDLLGSGATSQETTATTTTAKPQGGGLAPPAADRAATATGPAADPTTPSERPVTDPTTVDPPTANPATTDPTTVDGEVNTAKSASSSSGPATTAVTATGTGKSTAAVAAAQGRRRVRPVSLDPAATGMPETLGLAGAPAPASAQTPPVSQAKQSTPPSQADKPPSKVRRGATAARARPNAAAVPGGRSPRTRRPDQKS